MPYGQGQMLGAGVDPRMFVQDYSGFTRAAEIQAQGMQNLGATIGQGIKDFGEARQERKKIDAEIKATSAGIESAIKMGKDLGIDIGSYLSPIQAKINDPNTSPAEALALGRTAAQGISNAFTLGIGAQDRAIQQERQRSENAFKLANLEVAQQRANIYGQKAQAEASKLTKGTLSFFDPDTNQSEEMDVNYDPQGRPRVIGTGELIVDPVKVKYGEGGVEKPPETSQVGGISDSIAQTAKMNIGRLSTAKTPGTQGGGLGCADAVCKIYNQATGEELVKGGTLSTSKMIESLSSDPRFQSVPVSQAQAGDIIVTPRGKKAGHTGIFVSDNEIASNSSKGFNGGKPGTFKQNYSKGSWMNSVATRNPGSTQVFRRIEEAASPQMAGTPEQQAEVARQIEQGAGMAIVQAGGGMPTEPSLAQQQPQLLARRQVVATRPVGGGQQQQGTIMTQQQVNELEASGRQVSAVPTPDGNFRVTSVRTGTPQMGFEMTYDEQGRPILKQSATGVGAAPKVGEGQILSTDASGRPSIVNIPGGKADIEAQKAAQAAENERKFELDRAGIVLSEIDKLIGYAGEMSRLPGASTYRKFAPMAGFEGASEVENTLDTVKAGFRFETLQRLKEASPTGSSGLGAVTKPEFDALAEEKGKLTQVGDPRELQRRATNYKKMVLDTIHGSKQDRDKLLKEGKITKESYDAVESLYPGFQKKQPLAPEVMEIRKRLLGE
jgi:hypothetical protein